MQAYVPTNTFTALRMPLHWNELLYLGAKLPAASLCLPTSQLQASTQATDTRARSELVHTEVRIKIKHHPVCRSEF
jgi:hypothetical protein